MKCGGGGNKTLRDVIIYPKCEGSNDRVMHKQEGGEDDEFALKILLSQETNRCPFIPCGEDTLYSRRRHALTPSYIILLGPGTCAYHRRSKASSNIPIVYYKSS